MFQDEADEIEMKGGIERKISAKHSVANRLLEAGMLRFVCGAGYSLNNAVWRGCKGIASRGVNCVGKALHATAVVQQTYTL